MAGRELSSETRMSDVRQPEGGNKISHRSNEMSKRLDEIPGVGPGARHGSWSPALLIPRAFRSGARLLGLDRARRQGTCLGGSQQASDRYLRSLCVATAVCISGIGMPTEYSWPLLRSASMPPIFSFRAVSAARRSRTHRA